ncbi:rhomboid family intramembrane serine protease [uncultured Desulfobacter sp.]|uniref:rhomboid family intramembrane serine protease n=1 Tax=uncultured Desulfobacter sp. TaxID=240139 RepID=UPI002AAB2DDF|nr:rhomboid family intramembrane serine protease [uncultured Desulfobacter sp.]
MKIRYNSPVVLTYALLALLCLALPVSKFLGMSLASPSRLAFSDPRFYAGLLTYVLAHAGWSHLKGNLVMILLIGPLLEEKYGSWLIFEMMVITAGATALINAAIFHTSLVGGSGLVFMMILLSSFSNIRNREIPLAFILVAGIYMGSELTQVLNEDHISHFGHLAGGFFGAGFGFLRGKNR